jgi:hypothetical protein
MNTIFTLLTGHRGWQSACGLLLLLIGLNTGAAHAQTPTPGLIFKSATAGTPGAGVRDPNNDGYVSATAAGFSGGNDLGTASELNYRYLPQRVSTEPMSDVRVGPSTKFTDFADVGGGGATAGFYVAPNSATPTDYYYMFRFRLGGAAPNSKGYSIAIDTDNKFGFNGPNADPDAVAGNPGFEMEILLASNFGVRLYNINGTVAPSDKGLDGVAGPDGSMIELPYASYAQKAVAATNNDGTLDVFYDFYLPLSVIQAQFGDRTFFNSTGTTAVPFSLSTPLRMVANTVIAPHSMTHSQNISDIGGVNDAATPNADNAFIDLIGGFTPTSGGSLPSGNTILTRSAPPVVNSPLQKGATSVAGSSSEATGTVITVYVNGTALGTTTTVQAGGTWTLTGISALPAGALVKATALAPSKSTSDFSNEVLVSTTGSGACATAAPVVSCSSDSGVFGTAVPGATVYLRFPDGSLVPAPNTNKNLEANPVIANASGQFFFTTKGGNTSNCQSGQPGNLAGTYYISQVAPSTTCESAPDKECINAAQTPTPTITTKPVAANITSLSGTATTGSTVSLYADGSLFSSVTAAAGAFTFTGANLPTLVAGRTLVISATTNASTCTSPEVSVTVVTARSVVPPVVSSPLFTGAITVSGTSVEAAGSTITLTTYSGTAGAGVPTATYTTTVLADGTWTRTVTALAANSSVKATVTPTDYGVSGFSNVVPVLTRTALAPSITGSYNEGAGTVSGTVLAGTATNTVITVYEDGYPLSTVDANGNVVPLTAKTLANLTWSLDLATINSATSPALYAGGVLTATATATGQAESALSNAVTVGCPNLASKAIAAKAICQNSATTFTVTNAQDGIVYTLQDASSSSNVGVSKVGNGNDLVLTTPAYTTAGTYPLQLNTFYIGARVCQDNSTPVNLTVNPLPLARTTAAQNATIASYSQAQAGTNIQVQNSETTVSYQLVNTSVNANVGPAKTGTGGTLSFPTGPIDVSTTTNRRTTNYVVVGTSTTAPTNCAQQVGTASVNYSGPLPVELTSFDATASRADAVLAWRTASEKNNDHFVVERSANGREFAAIGEVAGQGTSSSAHDYAFRDAGALRLGKLLYYRLRQVDRDGNASQSPVRTVAFTSAEAPAAVLLYPNPSSTDVTCSLALLPAGTYTVQVLSVTGQLVSTTALTNEQPRSLQVSELPAGLYMVHVQGLGLTLTQRLVKLR